MAYFAHPMGDHLSLLNLYSKWLAVPAFQKPYWEENYGINGSKMSFISTTIKNITEAVFSNLGLIRKLNLLKVYQSGKGLDHNLEGGFTNIDRNTMFDAINTEADFTQYGAKPGCETEFNNHIKMIKDIHFKRGSSQYAKKYSTLVGGDGLHPDLMTIVGTIYGSYIDMKKSKHDNTGLSGGGKKDNKEQRAC